MNEITLEWFFELPGLFITGGVVLILIALMVFIISASKGKKQSDITNLNVDIDNEINKSEISSPVEPVVSEISTINNDVPVEPVSVENPISSFTPEPINVETPVQDIPNIVTPIVQENEFQKEEIQPTVMDNVHISEPVVSPVVEPITEILPVVEPTSTVANQQSSVPIENEKAPEAVVEPVPVVNAFEVPGEPVQKTVVPEPVTPQVVEPTVMEPIVTPVQKDSNQEVMEEI